MNVQKEVFHSNAKKGRFKAAIKKDNEVYSYKNYEDFISNKNIFNDTKNSLNIFPNTEIANFQVQSTKQKKSNSVSASENYNYSLKENFNLGFDFETDFIQLFLAILPFSLSSWLQFSPSRFVCFHSLRCSSCHPDCRCLQP